MPPELDPSLNQDQPVAPPPDAAPAAPPPASTPDTGPSLAELDPGTKSRSTLEALLDNVGKPEGDQKPADPVKPEDKAAPVDPTPKPAAPVADDLTPPEGMNDRSRARWETLTARVKEADQFRTKATDLEGQLTAVRQAVGETGMSQEDFVQVLHIGKLFKANDPQSLQQCMAQLDGLRADVATRLGIDAPGIDVLAAHPDLKGKVDGMTLSREDAMEIVKLRDANKRTSQAAAQNNDQAQFVAKVESGKASMVALLESKAALPGHQAKVDFIGKYFADPVKQQQFAKTYQPEQWAAAIEMIYDSVTVPAPAQPKPIIQPLRPGNTAIGARMPSGQGATAESAVAGAFERLGI